MSGMVQVVPKMRGGGWESHPSLLLDYSSSHSGVAVLCNRTGMTLLAPHHCGTGTLFAHDQPGGASMMQAFLAVVKQLHIHCKRPTLQQHNSMPSPPSPPYAPASCCNVPQVGASTVLAGVRCEVMVPSTDTPDQGILSVSVEMTSLATPEYRPGKSFGATSLIQQRLQDLLLGCGVVNLQDLCIAGGQGELGIRVYDAA
jgi:hypothetical protein